MAAERRNFFTVGNNKDVVFRATVVGTSSSLPKGTILETRRGFLSHVVTITPPSTDHASYPERRVLGFFKRNALMLVAGGTISQVEKIVRASVDEENQIGDYRSTRVRHVADLETTGGLSRTRVVTLLNKDGSSNRVKVDFDHATGVRTALFEAVGKIRRGSGGKLEFS